MARARATVFAASGDAGVPPWDDIVAGGVGSEIGVIAMSLLCWWKRWRHLMKRGVAGREKRNEE